MGTQISQEMAIVNMDSYAKQAYDKHSLKTLLLLCKSHGLEATCSSAFKVITWEKAALQVLDFASWGDETGKSLLAT